VGRRRIHAGSAGLVFHVINRGVRRSRIFDSDADYQTCLVVLAAAIERHPVRLMAYCLMPNHFHMVVMPTEDGQLSRMMHWFTGTHSRRWHLAKGTTGTGSVYQGRFKAFPVQRDDHFLAVCRYVERNPLRAGLVRSAEAWPWSSLADRARPRPMVNLTPWPVVRPTTWIENINEAHSSNEVGRVRLSIVKGVPFGSQAWSERVANTLGIQATVRNYAKKMSS
jgi:putative transposase